MSFVLDIAQKLHDLHACGSVESAGGLVRQKDIRVVYKRAGNGDALHLTAGHLRGLLFQLISQSYAFKRVDCALSALRFGNAGERQRQLNV